MCKVWNLGKNATRLSLLINVSWKTGVKVYTGEEANGHMIECLVCAQRFFQHGGDRFDFCPGCRREFTGYMETEYEDS